MVSRGSVDEDRAESSGRDGIASVDPLMYAQLDELTAAVNQTLPE